MSSTHPYYRRRMPKRQTEADFASDTFHVDVSSANAHLEPYDRINDPALANSQFDARAAAAVRAAVDIGRGVRIYPNVKWQNVGGTLGSDWPFHVEDDTGKVSDKPGTDLFSGKDLLEMKFYGDAAPTIFVPTAKCLAAMAYLDYFPDSSATHLRAMVSEAILAARPGWCGTFGPDVGIRDLLGDFLAGDYDMSQMHLLQIVYSYYDELSAEAREHLIDLLRAGRIHRPGLDEYFTSGKVPVDWRRAGFVGGAEITIGETENHILMILTARYLTNQLLYQRDPDPVYDNRRHGMISIFGLSLQVSPNCTELVLTLLQRMLRGDFSEYNAKPYQTETRMALLNLCTYAYDHEVRLAARMVLDYISAHIAVSSNDLRRMVPFRRRNEFPKNRTLDAPSTGFMNVGLLDSPLGADPMVENFAIQAGNMRAFEKSNNTLIPPADIYPVRPGKWAIASNGREMTMEALSGYRLPPSIHDLFVDDLHRRFFQGLHRVPRSEEVASGRNCDNMEIYASSPS
jgi:hypothetical protein